MARVTSNPYTIPNRFVLREVLIIRSQCNYYPRQTCITKLNGEWIEMNLPHTYDLTDTSKWKDNYRQAREEAKQYINPTQHRCARLSLANRNGYGYPFDIVEYLHEHAEVFGMNIVSADPRTPIEERINRYKKMDRYAVAEHIGSYGIEDMQEARWLLENFEIDLFISTTWLQLKLDKEKGLVIHQHRPLPALGLFSKILSIVDLNLTPDDINPKILFAMYKP